MLLPFSVIRQFASQGTPVSSDDESELDEDSSLEEEEEEEDSSQLDSSDDDSLHSTSSCGSSALISKNLLRSRDKPGDGSGSATGEAEHSR